MGSGSQSTTTVQKADPWGPARPYLQDALGSVTDLFNSGGFSADPYTGDRVAGFGGDTQQAQDMIRTMATSGTGATGQAQDYLGQMMSGDWQSEQLEAAKQNALSSAVPAAVAQFSGSGMTNSSQAMDTVGRAAAQAVAPYEYDAMNNMQTNALRGVALAPGIDQAGYLPAQMLGGVGAAQDAMGQSQIDAMMQAYYEGQGQDANNLSPYVNMLMGLGGQGGTSSSETTQPGPGMGQQIGGAALGGLGTYGALAANPVTAPFAIGGGVLSGLLGLF